MANAHQQAKGGMPQSFGLGENGIEMSKWHAITIAPQLKVAIFTLECAEHGIRCLAPNMVEEQAEELRDSCAETRSKPIALGG